MVLYNYIGNLNSNLVCCICRAPFTEPVTTRICAHTFCKACIVRAIEHAPLCPVDRSTLTIDDLLPASPIVRNLVEELIVECPHRAEGCDHTCQRQLLAAHLQDECAFAQLTSCSHLECGSRLRSNEAKDHAKECPHRAVECDGCGAKVHARNMESHQSECPVKSATCSFCSTSLPRSELTAHLTTCLDVTVPCTQFVNGCPWAGPRHSLSTVHTPSCPYESIKGFFALNGSRISSLTEDNILLKRKLELMEAAMQKMHREMHAVKAALGPWYRPEGAYSSFQPTPPVDRVAERAQRRHSHGPEPWLSPPLAASSSESPSSPLGRETDALAPYFPPQPEPAARPNPTRPSAGLHQYHSSLSVHPPPSLPPTVVVAPVNLSTTLEGSFASLRESVVTLSASVDSLARRNDIALRNETMRLNDELLTLRANIHGLRMQVHGIMMDRNAQVTGRADPMGVAEVRWPTHATSNPFLAYPHGPPPSVTKL